MKPKSLKEFVESIKYGSYVGTIFNDPLGDESRKYEHGPKDSSIVTKEFLDFWIDRYEKYVESFADPLTQSVFAVHSYLSRWRLDDEKKRSIAVEPYRVYVIRQRITGTFLHSDGIERVLTYHDEKPTGLFDSKEAAENTLKKYWKNYEKVG